MRYLITAVLPVLFATPALTSETKNYSVSHSVSINANAQDVWNVIGDFCDLDDWHPAFVGCALKTRDGGGVHRILTTQDGGQFVEKLIATEPGLSYTYSIIEAPVPLERYTGTLSIAPGDPTEVTWSSRFKSADPEMEGLITGVYEAGLAALETHFAR